MRNRYTYDFDLIIKFWRLSVRLCRINWSGKPYTIKGTERAKIDVLFFLDLGIGNLINCFFKWGIWFYIDILRFNVKESNYKAKGFTLPIFTIKT